MSVLARVFEEAGLTTVSIVLVREHAEKVKPPRALFIRYPDGRRRKHVLPEGHAGIVQLLEDSGSELLLGLLDINNEVYLCRDEDQGLSGDDRGSGPS